MEKCCNQCGVTLCDRNWVINHRSKNVLNKCLHCAHKRKGCRYIYYSLELKLLAKENAEKIHSRLQYILDPVKARKASRKYRSKNLDNCKQRCREYHNKNKDALNIRNKEYCISLADHYVKQLIRSANGLKPKDLLPQELVELKRQQIKLQREYYNKPNRL